MTDRIEWINATPPDDWGWGTENKSFLFDVQMLDFDGKLMHYGAKRTLQSPKEVIKNGYIGSLGVNAKKIKTINNAEKFSMLFAKSKKVIVEILEYGNKPDIGTGESKLLHEAQNEEGVVVGAAAADNWFNSTNGGGADSQGYTSTIGMEKVFAKVKRTIEVIESIRNTLPIDEGIEISAELQLLQKALDKTGEDLFQVSFNGTNTLVALIDLTNTIHNCRIEPFIAKAWKRYKDDFDADPNPSKWEPTVNLLNADGTPSHTVSGINRSKGNVESDKGIGLFSIDIPYDVWKDWSIHVIKRFGSKFNPNPEKSQAYQSIPEAANDVVVFSRGEKFYKDVVVDGKKETILNVRHKTNIDFLKDQIFKKNEIEKILELAETLAEDNELVDDNVIVWADDNMPKGSQLRIGYDAKVEELLKVYDWVYKYSVSSSPPEEKIAKVIMENDYGKRGCLLPYAKSTERKTRWFNASKIAADSSLLKTYKTTGHPEYVDEMRVRRHITDEDSEFFNDYNIDIKFMPVRRSECIAEGWIKSNKEEEE